MFSSVIIMILGVVEWSTQVLWNSNWFLKIFSPYNHENWRLHDFLPKLHYRISWSIVFLFSLEKSEKKTTTKNKQGNQQKNPRNSLYLTNRFAKSLHTKKNIIYLANFPITFFFSLTTPNTRKRKKCTFFNITLPVTVWYKLRIFTAISYRHL